MIEAAIGAAGKILEKIVDKLPLKRKNAPPKQTLRLVLQPRGAWWHMGAVDADKKPAMQVVCKWHVTNITTEQVVITTAFINKPKTEVILPLVKHPAENVYGGYPVLPKSTTELALDFWVQPPKCKEGETFKADVIVKDQFGNQHKIKGVEFKYR
jgi:hypothetical protein